MKGDYMEAEEIAKRFKEGVASGEFMKRMLAGFPRVCCRGSSVDFLRDANIAYVNTTGKVDPPAAGDFLLVDRDDIAKAVGGKETFDQIFGPVNAQGRWNTM